MNDLIWWVKTTSALCKLLYPCSFFWDLQRIRTKATTCPTRPTSIPPIAVRHATIYLLYPVILRGSKDPQHPIIFRLYTYLLIPLTFTLFSLSPPSFSSSLPHPPLVSKLPTSSPPTPSSPQTTTSSLPQHPLVVRLEASSAGWSGARFDAPRSVCRPAVVVSVGCPGVACGVREPSPPSSLLSVIRDFRAADLLLLM